MFSNYSLFLKNLINYFFLALRCKYKKKKDKIEVFRILVTLHYKSIMYPQLNQEISHKIFGIVLSAYSYDSLLYLFKEIFLDKSYYFKSTSDSPIILDCGANIGMSIAYFKTLYPKCKIIAFEPNPFAFSLLEKNIKQNKFSDIELNNVALTNHNGIVNFFISDFQGSLVGSLLNERGGENILNVNASKLTNYMLHDNYDLIKIDTEGSEFDILMNLVETEKINKCKLYIIEYHHNLGNNHRSFSDFLKFFEINNYEYNIQTNFYTLGEGQDILLKTYKNQ